MKEFIYYNELFDCYNKLLTQKEQEYFISYYSENLSYGEIALNKKVSRSAVQRAIKNVAKKLEEYESVLQINNNKQELINLLAEKDIKVIKEKIEGIVNN